MQGSIPGQEVRSHMLQLSSHASAKGLACLQWAAAK